MSKICGLTRLVLPFPLVCIPAPADVLGNRTSAQVSAYYTVIWISFQVEMCYKPSAISSRQSVVRKVAIGTTEIFS